MEKNARANGGTTPGLCGIAASGCVEGCSDWERSFARAMGGGAVGGA
jgi:hypothetical protein